MGKGEIARNEQFSPFPTVFSTLLENFSPFSSNLKLLSANSFSLGQLKICCLGKVEVYNKLSELSNLTEFTDDKINMKFTNQKKIFETAQNIMVKREKLLVNGLLYYFPTMFSKVFIFRIVKTFDCVSCCL